MTDSDNEDDRSSKRQKHEDASLSIQERAAAMTPAEVLALLQQVEQEKERNMELQITLAKTQKELQQSVQQFSTTGRAGTKKSRKAKRATNNSTAKPTDTTGSLVPITTKAEKLSCLTRQEKQKVLTRISSNINLFPGKKYTGKQVNEAKNLQLLLWHLNCNYCLQMHQFRGALAVAGVFTTDDANTESDSCRCNALSLESSFQTIQEPGAGSFILQIFSIAIPSHLNSSWEGSFLTRRVCNITLRQYLITRLFLLCAYRVASERSMAGACSAETYFQGTINPSNAVNILMP